ncbi:MAG: 4Fe-4S dicluster domain-containing protein [Gammaproteobacteria bacterium]
MKESPRIAAFTRDLYHCADCNYCVDAVWPERGLVHVCPTLQSHSPLTSYSGRGYVAAARAWHEGAALDLPTLGERVFTCTTCGHCETVCPIGLRPTQVARALRGDLWEHAAVPVPARQLRDAMRRDGNPNGVARAARQAWQSALPPPAPSATRPVRYLPGCAAATAHPAEARAAVALMRQAGYAVATLGDADSCCGAPLFELGLDDEAAALSDALAAKCVTPGPLVASGLECARSWARRDADSRTPEAFVPWLLARLDNGEFVPDPAREPPPVRLLDSCQSRDRDDHAQALRTLLSRLGVLIVESATSARHVVCCGAAGGMPRMAPGAAAHMATARLAEDGVYVGADARCVAHLRAHADPAHVQVFGIAEFVHHHFGAPA